MPSCFAFCGTGEKWEIFWPLQGNNSIQWNWQQRIQINWQLLILQICKVASSEVLLEVLVDFCHISIMCFFCCLFLSFCCLLGGGLKFLHSLFVSFVWMLDNYVFYYMNSSECLVDSSQWMLWLWDTPLAFFLGIHGSLEEMSLPRWGVKEKGRGRRRRRVKKDFNSQCNQYL